MRAFWVSAALVALVAVISLWVGSGVQRVTGEWIQELDGMVELAENGNWSELEPRLSSLHRDWMQHGGKFHLVMEHRDLDEVEELFAGAAAACAERDSVEFRIHIEQLRTQIVFLAETQQVNLKNIL